MSQEKPARTPQASKSVVERQMFADRVIAALETHAETVGHGFTRELEETLARGEKAPDMGRLPILVARRLGTLRDAMVAADLEHQRELGDDDEPRALRDATEAKLREKVTEVQEVATGIYGGKVLATLQLAGAPPANVRGLIHYAREAASAIDAADPELLPTARIKRAENDLSDWSRPLAGLADALEEALARVDTEAREAEATLSAKNKAVEDFNAFFRRSIGLLESLLVFVGETVLAEKVKPGLRAAPERAADAAKAPAESAKSTSPTG